MILSLQGCMAVGKTTAVRYLQIHMPGVHAGFEENGNVIAQVRARGLVKTRYEDFLEIQRLFIAKEIARWNAARAYSCTVMDFGAEEIEFYTLNYPKSLGMDWDVEGALGAELAALRTCLPDRILFLDADEATLRTRKTADGTRSREFFDYHLSRLLPLKRAWFLSRAGVDVLNVSRLTPDETGERVKRWVEQQWG